LKKSTTLQLVLAAMFTALGVLLPIAIHPFGISGSILLPMHIPVILCGFIVGWKHGALVGFVVPFISSFITGMPPLYPYAISMAFELAAYGFFAGYLSEKFNVIVSLIGAMLAGRVVMGIVNVVLLGLSGKTYAFSAFIAGAFVTALPGIIIQLILIPAIMIALKKTNVLERLSVNG
jgi:thiamine transporter ThiT